jgi:hypothetical protein
MRIKISTTEASAKLHNHTMRQLLRAIECNDNWTMTTTLHLFIFFIEKFSHSTTECACINYLFGRSFTVNATTSNYSCTMSYKLSLTLLPLLLLLLLLLCVMHFHSFRNC